MTTTACFCSVWDLALYSQLAIYPKDQQKKDCHLELGDFTLLVILDLVHFLLEFLHIILCCLLLLCCGIDGILQFHNGVLEVLNIRVELPVMRMPHFSKTGGGTHPRNIAPSNLILHQFCLVLFNLQLTLQGLPRLPPFPACLLAPL